MDPYKILGIDKNASKEEIKSAYRKLAKDHHPDANGGDDSKFKQINEAYKTLTDPVAKAQHEEDMFKRNPFSGVSPEDIFREFMSKRGFNFYSDSSFSSRVKMKQNGTNITVKVFLSLEEAFRGKSIEMNIDRLERLDANKLIQKNRKIKVNIPKGAKDGQQLVLKGQGNQGRGGGYDGNIIIIIQLKPNPLFSVREHNLYSKINVPFTQAILGDNIIFKNIDGENIDVTIPRFSQQNQNIEILNKGMPVGNSDVRGNLVLTINIEMPKSLNKEQLDIIRTLHKEI